MGLAAATVGAAAIGVGGSLISSGNSAKAAQQAGQQTSDATKYAADIQDKEYQQALALQMPGYRVGQGALGLYASALGLPGYALQAGGSPSASYTSGSPATNYTGGGFDANAYLAQNPDVARAYQAQLGQKGFASQFSTPQAYAQWHYTNFGQKEGRAEPLVASTPVAGAGSLASTGNTLTDQNNGALNSVLGGTDIGSIVKATPGYATQLQSGVDAIQAANAARGTLNGGGVLKALDDYGQKTFGNYYQNWLGNVGSLAGLGSSTANSIANQGQTNANSLGSLAITGANATGQAGVNAANAWSNGLGGATGALTGALTNFGANSYYKSPDPTAWTEGLG